MGEAASHLRQTSARGKNVRLAPHPHTPSSLASAPHVRNAWIITLS